MKSDWKLDMLLRLKVVPPDEETLAKNFGNYTLALQLLDRFIVAKMYDTFCQMTAVYAAYMNDLNSAAAAEMNRIQRKMQEGEFPIATRKYLIDNSKTIRQLHNKNRYPTFLLFPPKRNTSKVKTWTLME